MSSLPRPQDHKVPRRFYQKNYDSEERTEISTLDLFAYSGRDGANLFAELALSWLRRNWSTPVIQGDFLWADVDRLQAKASRLRAQVEDKEKVSNAEGEPNESEDFRYSALQQEHEFASRKANSVQRFQDAIGFQQMPLADRKKFASLSSSLRSSSAAGENGGEKLSREFWYWLLWEILELQGYDASFVRRSVWRAGKALDVLHPVCALGLEEIGEMEYDAGEVLELIGRLTAELDRAGKLSGRPIGGDARPLGIMEEGASAREGGVEGGVEGDSLGSLAGRLVSAAVVYGEDNFDALGEEVFAGAEELRVVDRVLRGMGGAVRLTPEEELARVME